LEHQGSCGRRKTGPHNPLEGDWAHAGAKTLTRIESQIQINSERLYLFSHAFGGQISSD
jgi:hypothetical protein